MLKIDEARVGIIGLGYVGLPLAVEFGKLMPTVGFDINTHRIAELKSGKDSTLEMNAIELTESLYLSYSDQIEDLKTCNVYIVTVPTPIDRYKRPDLTPLESASRMLGDVIRQDDVTIFESTVYPGATEEICVPIIESVSGLTFNKDFYVGYSPERINPGDKEHRVSNILKITSGSTPEAADFVDTLYKKIIKAGTHKTSNIRIAEAAKAIENTQRDVNIALVNELALIFNRLDIDTQEVLEAAGTKWNFLPFRPGLVGGHCIGIDPYYLTHKAQEIGYHPEVILAGRRINDSMGLYVAGEVLKTMNRARLQIRDARILIMGLTFKENCPDIRNTRVIDVIDELKLSNTIVDVYDPWVDRAEAEHEYDIHLVDEPEQGVYDAIVLAVAHQRFKDLGVDGIRAFGKAECILYDVKNTLPASKVDGRL
ncbi:MAG: Vi polysaccharide biosynthesis UDP-N-acetylglucosamine C-6 dehydrogenase TviB [Gammaproteobacteria bacterium]|nr:Vi polysaccharide biosynthesis UDP-N-acetylglucosamine C-6 dehydrogenase TviB [Gammaproteobacteria bacterium]